jgi:hypothetical protein
LWDQLWDQNAGPQSFPLDASNEVQHGQAEG